MLPDNKNACTAVLGPVTIRLLATKSDGWSRAKEEWQEQRQLNGRVAFPRQKKSKKIKESVQALWMEPLGATGFDSVPFRRPTVLEMEPDWSPCCAAPGLCWGCYSVWENNKIILWGQINRRAMAPVSRRPRPSQPNANAITSLCLDRAFKAACRANFQIHMHPWVRVWGYRPAFTGDGVSNSSAAGPFAKWLRCRILRAQH